MVTAAAQPSTVRHPLDGTLIALKPGQTTYDTVGKVVIDGFEMEVNRFGLVQLEAQVRIDNLYHPGDKFAVEPEKAAHVLKQRTSVGAPVVRLVPGNPNAAKSEATWHPPAAPAVPDAVSSAGLKAMRLTLRSAGKDPGLEASPEEVAAAFEELLVNVSYEEAAASGEPKPDDEVKAAEKGARRARATAGAPAGA